MNLTEAFKVLDSLTEDTFDLDQAGIAKLSDFEDDNFQDDAVQVIDVEATTEDELKNSYVGKIILDCQVCHSKHYADKENIILDETETLANVGEECPYCYTVDGFKIIGEIKPFETEGVESEVEVEDEVEEGLLAGDINLNLDARGFGGKDNNVSVLGGKLPIKESKSIEEGTFSRVINKIRRATLDENDPNNRKLYNFIDKFKKEFDIKCETHNAGYGYLPDGDTEVRDYHMYLECGPEMTKQFFIDGKAYKGLKPEYADRFTMSGAKNYKPNYAMSNGEIQVEIDPKIIHFYLHVIMDSEKANKDRDKFQKRFDKAYKTESKSIEESIESDIYSAVGKHFNHSVNSEFADLITDLVDRALSEEGEDIADNIMTAIDEGLIYNKDIWTIKEFYEEAALNDSTFENLFDDIHSIISAIKDDEDLEEKCLNEDIKDISITTDDTHMSMYTEDGGKVVVTSEPVEKESCEECEEVIEPISDETKAEIEIENEVEVEGEDDMIDFEIDEFDEESFDELGERYLKKVYENVNSFKCTNVFTKKDKLIVEGKVSFASGKVSPTKFVFEACSATKEGQVSFVGHNKNITRGNKAFTLNGVVKDKNLIAESFKYNYMSKNPEGKSSRIYGTIKKI